MKNALLTIILMFVSNFVFCQEKPYHVFVDECHELSATVWILAGCEEYNRSVYTPYYNDIHKFFKDSKSHPIMQFIKDMRNAPDSVEVIAYNSLPAATTLLYIEDSRVKVNSNIDIDEYFNTHDRRWNKENFMKYAALLDDFYVKSDFHKFFAKHMKLYRKYIEETDKYLSPYIKPECFTDIYGKEVPYIAICISPAYGSNNFSSTDIDTQKKLGYEKTGFYPIIGVNRSPEQISYTSIPYTVIHEISHSFTNPISSRYKEEFLKTGKKIYPYVKDELYKAGYDYEIMCLEFFNTLMSIVYMQELGLHESIIEHATYTAGYTGYIWIDRSLEFMQDFRNNRDKYRTIDDFMPQFISHMNEVANDMDKIAVRPKIISVTPAIGSVTTGDVKQIRIKFSEPIKEVWASTTNKELYNPIYPESEKELKKNIKSLGLDINKDNIEYVENDELVFNICVPLQSGKRYGIGIKNDFIYSKSNPYLPMGKGVTDIYFEVK